MNLNFFKKIQKTKSKATSLPTINSCHSSLSQLNDEDARVSEILSQMSRLRETDPDIWRAYFENEIEEEERNNTEYRVNNEIKQPIARRGVESSRPLNSSFSSSNPFRDNNSGADLTNHSYTERNADQGVLRDEFDSFVERRASTPPLQRMSSFPESKTAGQQEFMRETVNNREPIKRIYRSDNAFEASNLFSTTSKAEVEATQSRDVPSLRTNNTLFNVSNTQSHTQCAPFLQDTVPSAQAETTRKTEIPLDFIEYIYRTHDFFEKRYPLTPIHERPGANTVTFEPRNTCNQTDGNANSSIGQFQNLPITPTNTIAAQPAIVTSTPQISSASNHNNLPILPPRQPHNPPDTSNSRSLQHALGLIKLLLPTFDGDPDQLPQFADAARMLVESFPEYEKIILMSLATKFKGKAYSAFASRINQYANMESLLGDITTQYANIGKADLIFAELKLTVQTPAESVSDFGNWVRIKHNRLVSIFNSELGLDLADRSAGVRRANKEALQAFLCGLRPPP